MGQNGQDRAELWAQIGPRTLRKVASRFWLKVEVLGPQDCWQWQSQTRNGYGYLQVKLSSAGGQKRSICLGAHRIAWELVFGPIPQGLVICHACDNRPCCNPGHLFLGTQKDNMVDAARKGRIPHKLDASAVALIRKDPRPYTEIAPDYAVAPSTIGKIKRGEARTCAD